MKVEKTGATYQDVLDAPEHKVAEIIDGDLYVSPRPGPPHTSVASVLHVSVGGPFHLGVGGPGGWVILHEPELHFAARPKVSVLVPDLAGWRRERLASLDEYRDVAPDWICEVLSRSTRSVDRLKKMPIYAKAGVAHAWLVHPGFRTLEVFRLEVGQWVAGAVHRGDVRVRVEPFDAIELDLAQWWRDIPQPDRASEGEFAFEYEYGRTSP